MVYLDKNHKKPLGMGYFPEDLNVEKFNEILYKMVKEGKKYHKSAINSRMGRK